MCAVKQGHEASGREQSSPRLASLTYKYSDCGRFMGFVRYAREAENSPPLPFFSVYGWLSSKIIKLTQDYINGRKKQFNTCTQENHTMMLGSKNETWRNDQAGYLFIFV